MICFEEDGSFKRIGGSCIGGTTFIGLCNKLIGVDNFSELLELSVKGQEKSVDSMMTDFSDKDMISGHLGQESVDRNLLDDITFVSLGSINLRSSKIRDIEKADIARSMLHLVTFNMTELAYLYALTANCNRILFLGSFINNQIITQKLIFKAMDYLAKGLKKNVKA